MITYKRHHQKITPQPEFFELYSEISKDWEDKAARLLARRWDKVTNRQAKWEV